MKIWTDKQGKPVGIKEFFSRWKQGINNVTPLTQAGFNLFGNTLVLIGIILGVWFASSNHFSWLIIVLIGSFLMSGVSFLATLQRLLLLLDIEQMKNNFIESEGGNINHE